MFRLIKKFVAILRGGAGAREIFLGALIGAIIGMIPGLNLFLILGILAVLLLNANFAVVMFSFAMAKVACLLMAPQTFRIGYFLIHGTGLEPLIQKISEMPGLALLELDVYCLVGGLPIGAGFGFVFGTVLAILVNKLRTRMLKAKKNEKIEKLFKNIFVRIIIRLVLGKKKGDMAEGLEKESPFLRKKGVIVAVTALVLLLVAEFLVLQFGARKGAELAFTKANGAEVNIGDIDLSIFGGKAQISEIKATDPDEPTKNRFDAEEISIDFGVKDLLAKRFVLERMAVGKFDSGTPREEPGTVVVPEPDQDEGEDKPEDEEDLAGDLESYLTDYLDNKDKYNEYFRKAKDFLKKQHEAHKRRKEFTENLDPAKRMASLLELAKNHGYFSLSAKTFIATKPTWLVKEIEVGGISFGKLVPEQKFQLKDIASHPQLHPEPMSCAFVPKTGGAPTIAIRFHFDDPDAMHEAELNLEDLELGKEIKLSDKSDVLIRDGLATLKATGEVSEEQVVMTYTLLLTKFKMEPRGDREVLGMDPETAKEVFATLTTLELKGKIVGSLENPKFELEEDQLLETIKKGLKDAGKAILVKKMNEELDEAKSKAKEKIKEKIKDELGDKLSEELGDELGKELTDKLGDQVSEGAVEGAVDIASGIITGKKKEGESIDKEDVSKAAEKAVDVATELFKEKEKKKNEDKKDEEKSEKEKEEEKQKEELIDSAGGFLKGFLKKKDKKEENKEEEKKE